MEKRKVVKELTIIFWLFIIGSIIGYLTETIVALFQKGYFESRKGLVYGPFTPVYGIGIVIYYVLLNNMETNNKTKVFLITMAIGGIVEYLCSYIQEKVFGTISWDYSNLLFNINGRTSLLHCTYWGIAGVLYIMYIKPTIEWFKIKIENKSIELLTMAVLVFMIFDIGISFAAANRQTQRRQHRLPKDKFDVFLDRHYPDEFMDRVYANKEEI